MNLSAADLDALRILRPVAVKALHLASSALIESGHGANLRRAFDAIAVIDMLTGDGTREAWSREEHQLTCLRIAHERGCSVMFTPAGVVAFSRGERWFEIEDALDQDEDIEPVVSMALDHAFAEEEPNDD